MKKGMGRGAAVLALSSAASVALTLGPGLAAAYAFDDKDNRGCGDKKDGWDLFGDKDGKDHKDDRDGKDGIDGDKGLGHDDKGLGHDDKIDGDKQGRADDLGRNDRDDDWFDWDDKDKDRDKDHNCVGGVVAGVGVGVGGVGAGGVAAGGGGMAGGHDSSSPLLPIAGATVGALLIGAGVARRRAQGAV
ncbi:conserved membrane hypothetical protein [Frankia canadensis]|uniref:Uncharacterized protein n=1 Tax=Frankia canadensis TaxID=1836972 RepID=A0A2I2KIR5_9ACTN|nr:hypothetical protein [Frankia canadensis]SNQ45549.1 conserved membrane hypothetical protein [Frankia canadensis]SOU52839.1 conserved membrane hypothetical protein [Frankia canadensis]